MGTLASGSIDLKSLKVAGEPNKYITYIDATNGIRVHEAGAENTNFVQINSTGMSIYTGGQAESNKIAEFKSYITLGNRAVSLYESQATSLIPGTGSAAIGQGLIAQGDYSFASGYQTEAVGNFTHSEGWMTYAVGLFSHSEGELTYAYGNGSHAGGSYSKAGYKENDTLYGHYSFAHGDHVEAIANHQVVFGKYNETDSNAMFIVGNGTDDNNRSNLMAIGETSITIGSTGGMHMALDPNNGLEVFDENNSVAVFGNEARIGVDGANRVELNSTSIALITNNNEDALRSEVSGTTVRGGVPIQTFGNSIPSDTTMTFDLNLNDVQDGETFWVRVRTLISHARVQYATHGGKAARTMYTTATTESVAVAFTKAQSGTETKSVTMKFPKQYTLTSDYSPNIELTDYYNFTPTLVYDAANSTVQITAPTYPATRLVARTRQHTEIVDGTSYSFLIGVLRTTENRCSFALQRIEAEQNKYLPKTQINGRTYLALNADLDIPDVYDQAIKSAITTMSWDTDCIENGQLNLKALLMKLLGGANETDTDGIWTIRKWADGTAECWGTHTGTYNLTTAYNTAWYNNTIVEISLPSGLFTGEPTVTVSRQGRQGQGLISISPYSVTASKIGVFIFNTGMALSNEPLGISIHAVGRWK